MDYVGIQIDPMHDILSETASGSRVRSHSGRSDRSGKSSGSACSTRSMSAAHVPHGSTPATPTKMEIESVSTKRSEPDKPKVDLTFDPPRI